MSIIGIECLSYNKVLSLLIEYSYIPELRIERISFHINVLELSFMQVARDFNVFLLAFRKQLNL